MIKTPVNTTASTNVSGTLIASPIDNSSSTGSSSTEKISKSFSSYTVSSATINKNQSIPNGVTQYSDFSEASSVYNHPTALVHIIEEGLVSETSVAFEYGGATYYLIGGIDESNTSIKSYYNVNVATLKAAFGENNCSTSTTFGPGYECTDGNDFYARAYESGKVDAFGPNWGCYVLGYYSTCD